MTLSHPSFLALFSSIIIGSQVSIRLNLALENLKATFFFNLTLLLFLTLHAPCQSYP